MNNIDKQIWTFGYYFNYKVSGLPCIHCCMNAKQSGGHNNDVYVKKGCKFNHLCEGGLKGYNIQIQKYTSMISKPIAEDYAAFVEWSNVIQSHL